MLEMIARGVNRSDWQSLIHNNLTAEQQFLGHDVMQSRNRSELAGKIKEGVRRGGSLFSRNPGALILRFDQGHISLP